MQHKDQVNAAISAELRTWIKYKCFERRDRATARNIVDCKWVIKWKHEVLPDGKTRRIIRARLTIRGFKDQDAQDLIRYAGTSQCYSQRMLVSEAANRRWNIVSTDISKAFLQCHLQGIGGNNWRATARRQLLPTTIKCCRSQTA